ncbi:MAG: cysteine desulfurase [Candidatus Obscuribacterales bacterium]|nr:cysteine desulfurase [Candidatus Obscuribacterales bacterium]
MLRTIYLDNSATTPVRQEVREAMAPFLDDKWGNPSSVHYMGSLSKRAMDEARKSVAELLSCEVDEVYFTPCATYSNNVAILGRARFVDANGKGKHLITTKIEHPSCMGPAKYLESCGWEVTYLPVNHEGLVDPDDLKRKIKDNTSIISIMWANNEIGAVQPIAECARLAKEAGVFFHTDAVQVPGKIGINLKELPVDSLSISAHKFYGPKGIGALFVRRASNLMPIAFGGGQEMGLFPGTEPLPNIIALGKAAELAKKELESTVQHLRKLHKILTERLLGLDGVKLTGPACQEKRIPGHVSIVVPGVEGESVVLQADLRGLCVSAASACKKGIVQPSHVVSALGYCESDALGSVRITAGKFNSEEECSKAADILVRIIQSYKRPISAANTQSTALTAQS